MMAIRILLDHGVCEDRIVFITFVVARCGGVSVLQRAFPGVRIVTGAVDNGLRDGWVVGTGHEGRGRNVWVIGNFPSMRVSFHVRSTNVFAEPGMGQIGMSYSRSAHPDPHFETHRGQILFIEQHTESCIGT